jgi:hypothetical protein
MAGEGTTSGGTLWVRILMLGTSGTVLHCSCGCRGQAPDCPGKAAEEEPRAPAQEQESDE